MTVDSPSSLATAFFAAATREFAYLRDEPLYEETRLLKQLAGQSFEPVSPERVTSWFWAAVEFTCVRVRGRLTFDSREAEINLTVSPRWGTAEFGLWEWLEMVEGATASSGGSGRTVAGIEAEVAAHALDLLPLLGRIGSGAAADIEALSSARAWRSSEALAQDRARSHRAARAQADEAFRRGDYSRVVLALEAFANDLSPAERMKLKMARRKHGPA